MALKAVEEAPGVVTLLITTSVLKKIPAGNTGGAVDPRLLPAERAVSSVPVAFVVVTLVVAHFIPRMLLTLHVRAGWRYVGVVLTESPRELHRAATAVLPWAGWVFYAGSSILAGPRTPLINLTA